MLVLILIFELIIHHGFAKRRNFINCLIYKVHDTLDHIFISSKRITSWNENIFGYFSAQINSHWMKSLHIRSFFRSVFYRIGNEYGKIRTRQNFVFGHFRQWALSAELPYHITQRVGSNSCSQGGIPGSSATASYVCAKGSSLQQLPS